MNIQEASKKLLAGDLVVFPTETVYGLGALANNDEAVQKIFDVKGRPAINPLIVHIADEEQLRALVSEIPETAKILMKRFWPGPLTICFRKSDKVSGLVTAGLPTVCVRRPDHAVAQQLLELVGVPVAAPSANLSGKPSTTTFDDAKKQLEKKGVFFLDGGASPLGLESTVVDCSRTPVRVLRPGAIDKAALEEALGEGVVEESSSITISSPGQLLDHYAPTGQLTVLFGAREARRAWISSQASSAGAELALGIVGNLSTDAAHFLLAEDENDLPTYAQRLYRFLNWCDERGADKIILELPAGHHALLPALLNRLEKASRGHIVTL